MADDDWVTIRIPRRARKRIERIQTDIGRDGWGGIGVNRTDAPTIGNVVDESLRAFEAQVTRRGK